MLSHRLHQHLPSVDSEHFAPEPQQPGPHQTLSGRHGTKPVHGGAEAQLYNSFLTDINLERDQHEGLENESLQKDPERRRRGEHRNGQKSSPVIVVPNEQ